MSPKRGLGVEYPVTLLEAAEDGCVYAGGSFRIAGNARANGFACWNGREWIDGGLPRFATSIAIGPDGKTYVVGTDFDRVPRIFKATEVGWTIIPHPESSTSAAAIQPSQLAVSRDGVLYVAGRIPDYVGAWAFRILQFDGAEWEIIGVGGGDTYENTIQSMIVLPDGQLVVTGQFRRIAGLETSGIAIWDGTVWKAFGEGVTSESTSPRVQVVEYAGGRLFIGGAFDRVAGVAARTSRTSMTPGRHEMDGGVNGGVLAIEPLSNGDVVVGGNFDWASQVRAKPHCRLAAASGWS